MLKSIKVHALALLVSSGCSARLQVAVHAYDGERPIPQAYAIAFANHVIDSPDQRAQLATSASAATQEVRARYKLDAAGEREILDKIAGEIERSAASVQSHDPKPKGRKAKASQAQGQQAQEQPVRAAVVVAREFLRTCTEKKNRLDAGCLEIFTELRLSVAQEETMAVRTAAYASSELQGWVARSKSDSSEMRSEVGRIVDARFGRRSSSGIAANGKPDGRVVGTPIFDPMVGTLVRGSRPVRGKIGAMRVDPAHEWIPFSRAVFKAQGGNSQFVVVREGLLVFRQKSLDFDPTPVVGAGVATTKLGLKVASALMSAYGVPVGGGGQQEGGSSGAEAATADDIEGLKETLASRRARARAFVSRLANLYERLEQPGLNAEQIQALREDFAREVQLFEAHLASPDARE